MPWIIWGQNKFDTVLPFWTCIYACLYRHYLYIYIHDHTCVYNFMFISRCIYIHIFKTGIHTTGWEDGFPAILSCTCQSTILYRNTVKQSPRSLEVSSSDWSFLAAISVQTLLKKSEHHDHHTANGLARAWGDCARCLVVLPCSFSLLGRCRTHIPKHHSLKISWFSIPNTSLNIFARLTLAHAMCGSYVWTEVAAA